MAYNDYETSRSLGQPVELYQFIYGVAEDGETPIYFAHTDAEEEITHDGITYTPLPIKRTEIKSSGKIDTDEVTVTVPRDSDLADLFRIFPPNRVVTLRLRQGHLPNPNDPPGWDAGENFPVAWLGRVLEASRDGLEAKLTCESASASMKRPGLRRHYSWSCPLALYGPRCQADKAAATVSATVAAVSGNTVTLESPWIPTEDADPENDPGGEQVDSYTPADFTGGLIEWAGEAGPEQRSILSVTGDTIKMTGPARGLDVADTVSVSLGCPHTLEGCERLHSNVQNYGGHPFIPTYNPIGKNNHT